MERYDEILAEILDGTIDMWVKDSTNGWHYAPLTDEDTEE